MGWVVVLLLPWDLEWIMLIICIYNSGAYMSSCLWMTPTATTRDLFSPMASAVLSHTGVLCVHCGHSFVQSEGTACAFSLQQGKQQEYLGS